MDLQRVCLTQLPSSTINGYRSEGLGDVFRRFWEDKLICGLQMVRVSNCSPYIQLYVCVTAICKPIYICVSIYVASGNEHINLLKYFIASSKYFRVQLSKHTFLCPMLHYLIRAILVTILNNNIPYLNYCQIVKTVML